MAIFLLKSSKVEIKKGKKQLLVIRLARTGKKKQAYFRIVVADKRRAVTSKFIEILGNYDPHAKKLSLNQEKLEEYIKNGAQPSNSVAKLLAKEGLKLPKWVNITEKKRAPKKEPVVQEPKAEAAEAPAETEGGEPVAEEAVSETPETETLAEGSEPVESAEEATAEEATVEEEPSTEAPEEAEVTEEAKEEESAEK